MAGKSHGSGEKKEYEFACSLSGMLMRGKSKEDVLSQLILKDSRGKKYKYPVCPGCGKPVMTQRLKWAKHGDGFRAITGPGVYHMDRKPEAEEKKHLAREMRREKEISWLERNLGGIYRVSRGMSLVYAAISLFFVVAGVWLSSHPDFFTRLMASYIGVPFFGFCLALFVSRLVIRQWS